MRVSVVIPCHNAGQWISSALQSVADQTLAPVEVIVVDDASTDDSAARIARSTVVTKVIHVSVKNAAAARNEGIRAATGEWIALLDADDVWYPDHLARAAELLGKSDDVAFMSNHDWISLGGSVIQIPPEFVCKLSGPRSGLSLADFYDIAENGFHFGHSTVLYRRDRVMDAGLFDVTQKRRHDIDLWLRVVAGHTYTYDTVKSAGYRIEVQGSLSKDDQECDYYYLRALDKNRTAVDSPSFRRHLARQARRAMGRAFVDGPPDHYEQIRGLAWRNLHPTYKVLYLLASAWPGLVRWMMKTRRRMQAARMRSQHV